MRNTLSNKLMNKVKFLRNAVLIVAGVLVVCALIYFFYWVGKSTSYNLFYEDMVIETTRETIHEMVKAGSLK